MSTAQCAGNGSLTGRFKRMRFDLRQTSALVLAGVIVLCSSGCGSAPKPIVDSQAPKSTSTPSASPSTDASQNDSAGMSGFERQLPLSEHFVSQGTETVGSVEIARRSDGTVWATLTDFSTGASPNLKLYLNEGELVKNADGAWTTDGGESQDIAPVSAPASKQEIEIRGSQRMDEIHSVTIVDYTGPDFLHFGSAPLG